MAYDELEPIDHTSRIEVALAKLMTLIAGASRTSENQPVPRVQDFLPTWLSEHEPMSSDQMYKVALLLNEAFGGADLREDEKPN